jgi:hypothetical protein
MSGCSTVYSDVYSNKKSSFDWKKEKALIAANEQMRERAQAERNRKKTDGAEGGATDPNGGAAPLQLDSGLSPSPLGGSGLFGGGVDDLSKPAAPSAIPGTSSGLPSMGGGAVPGMSGGAVPGMGGTVPGMGGAVPGMGGAVPGMGGGMVPGMGGSMVPGMSGDAMKPGTPPPNQ